jgi:hypothetical protein
MSKKNIYFFNNLLNRYPVFNNFLNFLLWIAKQRTWES